MYSTFMYLSCIFSSFKFHVLGIHVIQIWYSATFSSTIMGHSADVQNSLDEATFLYILI